MVRRLIQRFLHWLRRLLAQPPRTKQPPLRRQLPPPPVKHRVAELPAPLEKRPKDLPRRPLNLTLNQDNNTTNGAETSPPRVPLNPASPRITTSSRFKVRLSDYEYFPSPAVQDLNRQLSTPEPPPEPQGKQLDKKKEEAATTSADLHPGLQKKVAPESPKPSQTVVKPQQQPQPVVESPGAAKLSLSEEFASTEELNSLLPAPREAKRDQPPEQPSSLPKVVPPSPLIAAPQPTSGVITKQGVIKLLFKLKRNNHHGYISPNDGSKDIIFHQKFIGSEVFSQLERGMKVEVTAHITEGKAYADQVRIL